MDTVKQPKRRNIGRRLSKAVERHGHEDVSRRTLTTFSGVFCPVALSQFSSVLFLRIGFVVGQVGILVGFLQLIMAYSILFLTVLSICAISTNMEIQGGGVYFMISRTLGPEFGGSIGLLFYCAQVFSCALYISGFVEGLVENFGPAGRFVHGVLPGDGPWWSYLYCTIIACICLAVCLVGGRLFAKTSLLILIIVIVCYTSSLASFIFHVPFAVPIPRSNEYLYHNVSENVTFYANFTGVSKETFLQNLWPSYSYDYTTFASGLITMTFTGVFAVLFSGVTGIMNGANMSGELKRPSFSIPVGTISAASFTFLCYSVAFFLTAMTCSRELLQGNYIYMQSISLWQPFVVIGIFATTLSAALGNLIGGSRIIEALARDNLFGLLLRPFQKTLRGNPLPAVLITFVLVQLVLLIGKLNAIAPAVSVFFLLAYAAVNMACGALDIASPSNFRPTFKLFMWQTCLIGFIGCLSMCFFINVVYALVAMLVFVALVLLLHYRDHDVSWGSISQALLFHQVRKYLLMLDSRKDHVKYWRPQILLLVANPRSAATLVQFVNDLKKGGLYIIGHVVGKELDDLQYDPTLETRKTWLSYVDYLNVKAFVEIALDRDVRRGLHQLCRISGLGGMKPHTVCMGFYDDAVPKDVLWAVNQEMERKRSTSLSALYSLRRRNPGASINIGSGCFSGSNVHEGSPLLVESGTSDRRDMENVVSNGKSRSGTRSESYEFAQNLPPLREGPLDEIEGSVVEDSIAHPRIEAEEYVRMIEDTLKMEKNICLCRNFVNMPPIRSRGLFALSYKERSGGFLSDATLSDRTPFDVAINEGASISMSNTDSVDGSPARSHRYIDVWPVNFFQPGSATLMDHTCLFMLQLGCVLRMAPAWRGAQLRVFLCADVHHGDVTSIRRQLNQLLAGVRIEAETQIVNWDQIVMELEQSGIPAGLLNVSLNASTSIEPSAEHDAEHYTSAMLNMSLFQPGLPDSYLQQVNQLIASHSSETAVTFLYLPRPPSSLRPDEVMDVVTPNDPSVTRAERLEYLEQLTILTNRLPPTVLVHGLHSVMSS